MDVLDGSDEVGTLTYVCPVCGWEEKRYGRTAAVGEAGRGVSQSEPTGFGRTLASLRTWIKEDGPIFLWPGILIVAVVLFLLLFGMEGVDKVLYWAGLILFAPE